MATLHVYTNLEQVPTLVLTWDHQRMKKVNVEDLRVSLDKATPFKPTHVRIEGDDPLSLAVLVDATKPSDELLGKVVDAVSGLAPGAQSPVLKPHDHVTIYGMGCALVRSGEDVPASAATMRESLLKVLDAARGSGAVKANSACKPALPLWDAMAVVASRLRKLPGRRILLVMSDGVDTGSKTPAPTLLTRVQESGIAVFAVRPEVSQERMAQPGSIDRLHLSVLIPGTAITDGVDTMRVLAESSGGVVVMANRWNLAKQLRWVDEMIRGRYILEFPRKNEDTAGVHSMMVTLPKTDAFVRPTGISVPIADQKILNSPMSIPSGVGAQQSGAAEPEEPKAPSPASPQ